MLVAMAVVALTAMAQNPDGLKGVLAATDWQSALSLTEAAQATMTAEEAAKAYNKVVDLALAKYNDESAAAIKNQVTATAYDKAGMEAAAVAAITYALVCDEYDNQPNEKGKVKPKYHNANISRLAGVRNDLLGVGEGQFNVRDFAAAGKTFALYVDTSDDFVTGGHAADPAYCQIAYYASLGFYNSEDYASAAKYAAIAQGDESVADDALNVQIMSMKAQVTTPEDSVKYLAQVQELYNADPTNERFFSLIYEYYSTSGDEAKKSDLINKQLELNPQSVMAWALKGESAMAGSRWDEAIEAYKKSLEINPEFIQVRLNLAVCQNNKAITLKEANNGQMTDEATAYVNESIANLTTVREKDPNQETVRWAYMLYQAYYLLGNEAGMAEVEPLINQ